MMSSRGPSTLETADLPPKQEGLEANNDASKTSVSKASFASPPWFRLKDPRVVRVSRAFGGKDRHSKVCTIRGLRDRRVRLSVPTAIQLYDLQDRLGLSQPSKVVDWLLDAAKHEIDELPPLPMQPVHLGHPQLFHQYSSSPSTVSSSLGTDQNLSSNREMGLIDGINWDGGNNLGKSSRRKFVQNSDSSCRNKSSADCADEGNRGRIRRNDQEEISQGSQAQVDKELVRQTNFSSRASSSYNLPYGSNVYHLEPSNIASVPHHGLITSQSSSENPQSLNIHHIPSALSLSQTHPYFPVQFITSSGTEMDHQQVSQFQPTFMMSSGLQNFLPSAHELPLSSLSHHQSSSVRAPFMSFDVNATAVPTQSSSGNEMDKD